MNTLFLLMIAGISQGLANTIRKISSTHEHRATTITVTTMLVNSLLALPLVFWDFRLPAHPTTWILVICSTITFALSAAYMFKAYQHLELSFMSILQRLSIIFVAAIGIIAIGERITYTAAIGICLLFAGSMSILYEGKRIVLSQGAWYTIISTFLGSIAAVLDKQILTDFSPVTYVFVNNLLVGLVFAWRKHTLRESWNFLHRYPVQILSSSFFGIAGFTGLMIVLSRSQVSVTMPVYKTVSFLAPVTLGILWFGETRKLRQKLVGTILAVIGIILVYI